MANTKQAKKRAIQSEKLRQENVDRRSRLRTFIKKVLLAIKAGNKEQAATEFKTAVPVIDSNARKGIIHKNKAARHKSRLSARIKAMA